MGAEAGTAIGWIGTSRWETLPADRMRPRAPRRIYTVRPIHSPRRSPWTDRDDVGTFRPEPRRHRGLTCINTAIVAAAPVDEPARDRHTRALDGKRSLRPTSVKRAPSDSGCCAADEAPRPCRRRRCGNASGRARTPVSPVLLGDDDTRPSATPSSTSRSRSPSSLCPAALFAFALVCLVATALVRSVRAIRAADEELVATT